MWGTSDFLGGAASRRLPTFAVYGISQVFGLISLAAVLMIAGEGSAVASVVPMGIAAGLTGMVAMIAFYRALALGPMGIVSPIGALGVLVPLAWGLLGGETPTGAQLLGIIAAIVGILLASGPELSGPAGLKPLILAAIGGLGFGFVFLLMAEGSKESAVATMTVMRVTTVTVFVIGVAAVAAVRPRGVGRRDIPQLAAIGVLDAGANVTYGIATTMGLLSITSVLASLYPVLTALLAAVILHERLKPVQYVGVASALTGIAFITSGG